MIYKLLNKLFGWDYIGWVYPEAELTGISRVQVDGMGRAWYWLSKRERVMDIIEDPADAIWLTCSPDKYFSPTPNDEDKQ